MKDEIPRFGSYDPNTKTSTGGEMSLNDEPCETKLSALSEDYRRLQAENERMLEEISKVAADVSGMVEFYSYSDNERSKEFEFICNDLQRILEEK